MSTNAYVRRQFNNGVSVTDTIPAGISSSATSFVLADGSTFPDGSVGPFIVTIDQGLASEERVLCLSRSGSTVTVDSGGRGYNSTTAQIHGANCSVLHTMDQQDLDEANQAVVATLGAVTTSGDLLVGSGSHALSRLAKGAANSFLQAGASTLGWASFPTGQSQSIGTSNQDGSDTTPARADHAHKLSAADSTTSTFTNKRVTRRVVSVTQSATPAINTDNTDVATITGLAQAITSMTSSLTGTPVAGDLLELQITDNGTARAITWGASFVGPLPATTQISIPLIVRLEWNGSAWNCVWSSQAPLGNLGYAQITANQGSITSVTDITGLTTTVTVQAGKRVKITAFCGSYSGGSADIYTWNIQESSTVLQTASVSSPGSGAQTTATAVLTPTAGAHTYKITSAHSVGSTSGQVNASSTQPAFILVEDIGI